LVDAQRRTGWAAVGGGVENDATSRIVDRAVFFCEYHRHMAPVQEGPTDAIPGMNVAYDMQALGALRDVFTRGLWETFVHEQIRDAGHETGLDPHIVVGHRKHFTIRMFLSERFHYSRSFAGMRVQGASLRTRLGWALKSLALPPVLVARVTSSVMARPEHRRHYLSTLPLVVLFSSAWAVGEFVGYLAGPGDSILKVR
jgi:hypothetical protein